MKVTLKRNNQPVIIVDQSPDGNPKHYALTTLSGEEVYNEDCDCGNKAWHKMDKDRCDCSWCSDGFFHKEELTFKH